MRGEFRFNGGMSERISEFGPDTLQSILAIHQPVKRWLVGFSGGLDSSALLAALVAARPQQPVLALHVNHGSSPRAADWAEHCQALCRQWQVECRVETVTVRPAGGGWEEAARNARYRVFENYMEEGDVLLLGHHRDDQVETLLFRLMRGAGPRGLGAIVAARPFGRGRLIRPLLDFSRGQLEDYARRSGLEWIEDESNREEKFDRNFLRKRVFPLLEQRWPDFSRRWARTAEACQQADQLSRDLGEVDLRNCGERAERLGWSIDWKIFVRLPDYRRVNLLRSWALRHDLPVMERKHQEQIRKQLLGATPSSEAVVGWGRASLRYYRERLYLLAAPVPAVGQPLAWSLEKELTLPDGGCLLAERSSSGGLHLPEGPVEIRWRTGGERCRPTGRARSQTLKKLLQEYGLEPWLRDRVPLLYCNGELAAVGDLWVCQDYFTAEGPAWRLRWQVGSGPR